MITIEHRPNRVDVTVFGEFTLADYQEIEKLVNYTVAFEGDVDLLMDLRTMAGATLDVVWEDMKFVRAHVNDFRRIAVVSDSQWVTWSVCLTGVFVKAQVEVFDDLEEAEGWLAQPVA